ncbi:MAG: flagellar hook-length control protein FliK [Pseudomonadota bacterium]
MPIPTTNLPPPSSATVNATMNDTPGNGDFSRLLARELAGKTHEHKPVAESPDASTTPSQADNETLPLPSGQDATTTALLAQTPGIQSGKVAPDYLQQIYGEMSGKIADEARSATLSDQIAGETLSTALSRTTNGTLLIALSNTASGEMPTAAQPGQAANEALLTALSDQTPGGLPLATSFNPIPGRGPLAASSNPIPGGVALTSLQTGTSAQRNLSQGTHPTKSASGLDSTDPESDKTANFAASDKFLPLVAADDKMSRAATQLLAQDSSGAMSSPQTGISSAIAAASLIPGTSSIDQNQNPRLDARVGTPAWDGALAQKVTWMVTQQLQVAQLQLNPPNLGPMEVMLTVGNGPDPQTRIEFTSPHLVVREAIQAALPHLREMMENSGLSLGSATVSADSFQQQAQAGRQDHASPRQAENMPQIASELAAHSATIRVHAGLVDTFA